MRVECSPKAGAITWRRGQLSDHTHIDRAQMSLVYPDLVPGQQVRFPARGAWHFGVLVGIDGTFAVVRTTGADRRQRVPATAVHPWPATYGSPAAARSSTSTARSRDTRPAGIDVSPASIRAGISPLPSPATSHTIARAASSAG